MATLSRGLPRRFFSSHNQPFARQFTETDAAEAETAHERAYFTAFPATIVGARLEFRFFTVFKGIFHTDAFCVTRVSECFPGHIGERMKKLEREQREFYELEFIFKSDCSAIFVLSVVSLFLCCFFCSATASTLNGNPIDFSRAYPFLSFPAEVTIEIWSP